MSWFKIAANFLRDAMGSSETTEQAEPTPLPPTDVEGVVLLINKHRTEIDANFQAVAQMIAAQNAKQARALEIQKRWNYALSAAALILAAAFGFLFYKMALR
jgi:hypothetical protein